MRMIRLAASTFAAAALVLTGVAVPALTTRASAWAQPSAIIPFTPGGLGTDTYFVPVSTGTRPFAAAVVFGFVNDTGGSVAVTGFGTSARHGALNSGSNTSVVPAGQVYLDAVTVVGFGSWEFQADLSDGETVAWTIDTGDFIHLLSPGTLDVMPLSTPPAVGNLGEVEPPLVGDGEFKEISIEATDRLASAPPALVSCVTTPPLELQGTCQTTAQANETTISARVGFPLQTSLSGWYAGPSVGGLAVTMTSEIPSALADEVGVPVTPLVVLAVPVLYTVPPVLPSSTEASASTTRWTPVIFDTGQGDSGTSLLAAALSGSDPSAFEIERSSTDDAPPSGGGPWSPLDVKLVATTPGTYDAEVVATFDPPGEDYTITVPVTGTVSATSTTTTSTITSPTPVVFTPPAPDPVAVGQTCGAGGTKVDIWGQDLAGSVVRFAGMTSALVIVLGPGEVQATVPHGVERDGRIVVVGQGGQAVAVPQARWHPACPTTTYLRSLTPLPGGRVRVVAASTAVGAEVAVLRDGVTVGSAVVPPDESITMDVAAELPGRWQVVFDGSAHLRASGGQVMEMRGL